MKIYSLKALNKKHENPILFIHGLMHGAWCWQKFYMPYFQKAGYDVYAIDLSNHYENQKEKSLKFTTLGDYVNDVKEAIEHIGEECILIGHSMGGMIVQKFLVENTCHKVVLIAPNPPKGVISTVLKLALKHPLRFLIANIKMSLIPILGDKETAKWLFFGYTMDKEVFEESFAKLQDDSFFAFLGIVFPFLKKAQQKIETLVIGAKDDNAISESAIVETADFHLGEYKFFDNMAHDMMLEKEWQKPADYIIEWLK